MNSNGNATHADVLVLGFGKAGKSAAAQLGRLGKRVVLVEQSERMYGGTCPNVGCVPSKGMVHHSGLRRPDDPPQEFYARAVDDVQAVREFMRAGNRDAMNAMETVELITGHADLRRPAHGARRGRRRAAHDHRRHDPAEHRLGAEHP